MPAAQVGRSALFLDLDGVINVDRPYVHTISDFVFMDGIFNLARRAVLAGLELVVITNQAGIGRGLYTEAQFDQLTDWMCEQFAQQGGPISKVYFCPYHAQHGVGRYKAESFDRKPNPGMILRAQRELNLVLESSVLVGDKVSDILAARAAKIGTTVLLTLGHDPVIPKPDFQAESLNRIEEYLFGQNLPHAN